MTHATPGQPRKVAVVGVALSDCGRVDDATPYALHAQAARRALADSGLDRSVVDGFASAGLGTLAPVEVAEYLGLRPTWVDSTSVGGSTWEVMAAHAADAIAAGPRQRRPAGLRLHRPRRHQGGPPHRATSPSAPAARSSSRSRTATR